MIRWLGALIGFVFFRFPGAILGFAIGMLLDVSSSSRRTTTTFARKPQVSPADFEFNLLSLAAIVIKADGRVAPEEMRYVQAYFVQAYGKERANATFRTFNEVAKTRQVSARKIAEYLRTRTRYESRLQLVHFLFNIAQADGVVSEPEVKKINEIAGFLAIGYRDFESIKAMFFKTADSAYRILEIDQNATVAQIKSAYRTMAKKYHPDKLQHMDEAYRKGAEEKFRRVQQAYEQLQKEQGF